MKGKRKAQNIKILPKSSTLQEIRQDPTEHYSTDQPRMAKKKKVNKNSNKEKHTQKQGIFQKQLEIQ